MPEDFDVARLWAITVAAETFHTSPYRIAQELDEDPEQLNLECHTLLNYSRAKDLFDRAMKDGDHKTLDEYNNSDLMCSVRRNALDNRKERLLHRKQHPDTEGYRLDCRLCVSAHRNDPKHRHPKRVAGCPLCED